MFEQLMNLVREGAQDSVVNNPDVPNEQNEAVIQEAGNSITSTLQSMLANGKGADVLSLFGGNQGNINDHPVVQNISGNFISNIMNKFGLSNAQAGGIAGSLIPMILGKLVNRTNDSNDSSFNLQDIFNKLSNNGTSGLNIPGMLSKLTAGKGLDQNQDGHVDLSDLTAAFSGSSTERKEGDDGGILGKLKGMVGM